MKNLIFLKSKINQQKIFFHKLKYYGQDYSSEIPLLLIQVLKNVFKSCAEWTKNEKYVTVSYLLQITAPKKIVKTPKKADSFTLLFIGVCLIKIVF